VRRAKLYYLRNLSGKKARIKEKLQARSGLSSKAGGAGAPADSATEAGADTGAQ
jgi:large subunit ribosomal protein L19